MDVETEADQLCETTYGSRAEPIIQMIRGVHDKALPPTRRSVGRRSGSVT